MTFGQKIAPYLAELIKNISDKNMYSGNKIPSSVMAMFKLEIRENGAGILVPYWIGVLQKGRKPRRSTKSSGLAKKIFKWMSKRNMFKSTTLKGKRNEAKQLTWYINKHGNKQFNKGNPIFVDIYESERAKTIKKIDAEIGMTIGKITMEII